MADTQENLRLAEAAALLGVHVDTLKRWADDGKVTSWRTPGGHRRFKRADVLALLAADAPTGGEAA